jgi:deoxyadenosine/deoxycytidine kinase
MRISLEGNIGCGKSTVIELLRQWGLDARPEPIDKWGNLLNLAYKNPFRWSFPFNVRVLVSMIDTPQGVVLERSPLATRAVFAQMGFNAGNISARDWETFRSLYSIIGWEPDAIIYINTPADECFRRISTRGRRCESDIKPEYINGIEFQYTNMLRQFSGPVATIDGNLQPEEVARKVHEAIVSLRTIEVQQQ